VIPDEVSELSLHAIADHGVAHRLADDQSDLRGGAGLARCVEEQVYDQGSTTGPPAGSHGAPEGITVAQPVSGGEHEGLMSELAQTARLLRPLRRRCEMMARPARVRMRRRNPCTLWRRRLFGW
jgi:hypothetical protein